MIHLTMQSRGALEGTFDGAPKHDLNDLHKDPQEGASKVALQGAPEVALELHLWLHVSMQSLMNKYVQNRSSNGGSDASLEDVLDGGIHVGLEWAS